MTKLIYRARGASHRRKANPITVRTYVGLLGLFPVVSMALTSLVGNVVAAIVIASVGMVTLLGVLPQGD